MTPLSIAAYLALFGGVGFLFLFANLVVGRLLRPNLPNPEKLDVYECGEPAIGSSFVQFDLRFYVVALLFIIFDVEIAFFFPWATVFGKATNLADKEFDTVVWSAQDHAQQLTPPAVGLYRELGVPNPTLASVVPPVEPTSRRSEDENQQAIRDSATRLALISVIDILVFFAVLMVGFFYVWKRGDLDWVRAVSHQRAQRPQRSLPDALTEAEPALAS